MKSSKVSSAQARDVRGHSNKVYDLYSSRVVKIERDYIGSSYRRRRTFNVSCQCNLLCTCRKLASPATKYFSAPKQVYRYSGVRNITDIGVGSVKALQRRRIRRIYLPETIDKAIGSADRMSINRRHKPRSEESFYDYKKTSSKCVGGIIDTDNVSFVSRKLSPIVQKKSGTTSPRRVIAKDHDHSRNKDSSEGHKRKSTIAIQANIHNSNPIPHPQEEKLNSKIKTDQTSQQTTLPSEVTKNKQTKSVVTTDNTEICKDYSSDSLVQHVHNLENPTDEKQSKMSIDPMENKLEREYRKIFSSKSKEKPGVDKTMPDLKSASLLRRRFEALRRGIGKKESKKESLSRINAKIYKDVIITSDPSSLESQRFETSKREMSKKECNKENNSLDKTLSPTSVPSRKDVSIASDPPSLEGRSYSNTKTYSPYQSTLNDNRRNINTLPKKKPKSKNNDNMQLSADFGDSKCESVQGMFKLWGKKFNLDEDNFQASPTIYNDIPKDSEQIISKLEEGPRGEVSKKKEGRKFFFFGKRHKNKNKEKDSTPAYLSYKSKKGVTTGRCEVTDGLTIKVGANSNCPAIEPVKNTEIHLEKYEETFRKAWLDKFISNRRDSRNSVHIRWNNHMYGTSSSTVLELIDSMYKQTGIDFRSRSEITTTESSNYHPYTKQRVHFMQQDIETWMIPKMITEREKGDTDKITCARNKYVKNIPIKISNHRCFTDAVTGFSRTIELVLYSKSDKSSEYVIINIPEGYFSKSSSEPQAQSSDEKIFNIVEYEASDVRKLKETCETAIRHNINNRKVTVGIQNDEDEQRNAKSKTLDDTTNNPSLLRDVAIQGSDVFVPKRCDVIGVGIITQRDIRDVRKQVLRVEDDLTEDESLGNMVIPKKCELAESYLQDYCRNTWIPSGIDTLSWRISDSELHSSINNSIGSFSQGDGAKSCHNIYDGFQESTIILSSCKTSSCSHCIALEEEKKQDDSLKCKFFSKFRKKSSSEGPTNSDKRTLPKDSVEVHKKRQFYACTNQRYKWFNEKKSESSDEVKECPKLNKPCWRLPNSNKIKKPRNKHVSLPNCEEMGNLVAQLSDKSIEGILSYKGSECKRKGSRSPTRIEISSKQVCEIPQPPCKESCLTETKPACTKENAPLCEDLPDETEPKTLPPCERKPSPIQKLPLCSKPVKKTPCSACYTPPCRGTSKANRSRDDVGKITSQESGLSLKISPGPSPKNSESCLKTNPKVTANKLEKKCIPNCANTKKIPLKPSPRVCNRPQSLPDVCYDGSKDKMTGLHLKKMPSKKKASCNNSYGDDVSPGVIRISSKENLTIRMKKETPSTEEIRECINVKVQDEDGQTLYERIDYKHSGDGKRCIYKDIYKDPLIQRVSTPTTVQDVMAPNKSQNEVCKANSDTSIDNLIEINLTLKLKQGDKGTEVNIKNVGDTEIINKNEIQPKDSQRDMYVLQNQTEHEPAVAKNRKDVNIKIIIKNYATDCDKNNETETYAVNNTENFAQRISEKFQTVSTGYSDLMDKHTFSIHRATVDLTSSVDKCLQTKPSACDQLDNTREKTSSQSVTDRTVTNKTVNSTNYNDEAVNSMTTIKKSSTYNTDMSCEENDEFRNKSNKHSFLNPNEHTKEKVNETTNDSLLHDKIKLHNRAEKKAMFKKLFQSPSAIKKPENEKRINEIIGAVFTSDSSGPENISCNELAKELTYASLDPTYLRDTDSLNNYYELDSELPYIKEISDRKLNPTKDNSEIESDECPVNENNEECLCSTIATKLNLRLNGGLKSGCCCQRSIKKDVTINCDLGTNEYLLSLRQASIDVETQSSKHVASKIKSGNLSVQSKTQSVVMTNTSVTVKTSRNISNHPETKCKSIKTFFPDLNEMNYCGVKAINKETILGLSDDDVLVFNSNILQISNSKGKRKISKQTNSEQASVNILQLNETKKAVLEIYAEKIVSDEGERIVAKLPKFHIDEETDISNYESVVTARKKLSRRNFIMMSVNR